MSATVMTHDVSEERANRAGLGLSVRAVFLALLLVLTLALRVAELDTAPLSAGEAHQALSAWRVASATAPGLATPNSSPVLFAVQVITFSTLGASELTVRLLTALAGVALAFLPLLFSDLLGRTRALILTVMLACSPVLLIAARTGNGMIWTALLLGVGLWAVWRYWESGAGQWAVLAVVCAGAVALLTEPSGFVQLLIILAAGVVAWQRRPQPESAAWEEDELPNLADITMSERLAALPLGRALWVLAGVVALVVTLGMTYPAGVSNLAELVGAAVRGMWQRGADVPAGMPIWTALLYEAVILILALAAMRWLDKHDQFGFVERFALAWLAFGVTAALAYQGAGAAQAAWITIPAAILASSAAVAWFGLPRPDRIFGAFPAWPKALIAVLMVALLVMLTIHLQLFGRALLQEQDVTMQLGQNSAASLVMVIITGMFIVIGYFMAANLWNGEIAAHGMLVGLAGFGLVMSMAAGWRVTTLDATRASVFWHMQPTGADVFTLREMLGEFAKREAGGFPEIQVMAQVPEDSAVAWALRDYPQTQFIQSAESAKTAEIVLLPQSDVIPDLGGSYVGMPLMVASRWNWTALQSHELIAWWTQGRLTALNPISERLVLWVRQDVYDGALSS